jgi:hypothetical protein
VRIPERFGARLGIGICLLGFVLIFIGWNGAASVNSLAAQFPYLISGGIGGLALVVLGAALIIVEVGREDRQRLHDEIAAITPGAPSPNGKVAPKVPAGEEPSTTRGAFVAGETSYHLPSCRLLEGRGDLPRVTREQAAKRKLSACRVCKPEGARSQAGPRARRR